MEKKILTLLSSICVVSLPFVIKGSGKPNIGKPKEVNETIGEVKQSQELSNIPIREKEIKTFSPPGLKENLLVFFSKGVLSTVVDSFIVTSQRVKYPVRPLPKVFSTNIIYDLLFFPILSVIWVKMSYNDDLGEILLKSLIISVPMSSAQWYMERNTILLKWNQWTPLHTFGFVSFTLFMIRGLIGLIKTIEEPKLFIGDSHHY